jgi:hypothetical protein
MSVTRISATIFLLLAAYIVVGAALLPAPAVGAEATEPLLSALGLGWFFAVWTALVAAMVFLIVWTSAGVVATEHARDKRRTEYDPAAAGIEAAEERVLALAS